MDEAVSAARRWPLAVMALVSVLIIGHFAAIFANVLAAPSGPWPTDDGPNMATPPRFAAVALDAAVPYLNAVKLTHNYHFTENHVSRFWTQHMVGRVAVKLRDAKGVEIATVALPDPNANPQVRFLQQLLVDGLTKDAPVEPFEGERIPAPNQAPRTVRYWEFGEGPKAKLGTMAEHLIPRDRPISGPSDWSMIVARSIARQLCAQKGAASAEIIRETRLVLPPEMIDDRSGEPIKLGDTVEVSFGEMHASP